MATNDTKFLTYVEDSAGVEQRQAIQKIDATVATNGIDNDAIPGSKVDLEDDLNPTDVAPVAAPTIVGSPTIPVELEVIVADGTSADVGTFDMPWKARLVGIRAVKTGAAGASGDLFEVESAAGGTGTNIAYADLQVGDTFTTTDNVINDAAADLAAGATIHFRRIRAGAGSPNTACRAYLTFHKHS